MAAGDLDRRLAVATCSHCGAIYDLASRADRAEPAPAPLRAPVALPPRFTLDRRADSLVVRWRWFTPIALFSLFFCIAWNGFLVGWYGLATQGDAPAVVNIVMLLFPLGHVAVGLGLSYWTLAHLFNHTVVAVQQDQLTVRHGPIPWLPQPTLATRDIEQLYCTRKVNHGKNGTSVRYALRAVTRDHSGLLLLSGLADLDQALWLEQEIEGLLDLRDRPVAGEFKGGEDRS